MFKKLLSNLPFNPSLLGQVSFYMQRLKKESAVRGAGLIALVLALVIHTFAVISPPQSSLAKSPNDIIYGGFASRDQAVLYCLDKNKDIYRIFEYYGLTCDIISNASTITIRSNAADYHSIGRTPIANPSPRNHKNWTIYQVSIPGVEDPLWMKDLQYWDSGPYSDYKVLKMTNKHGQPIFIMYDCGNIVTIGKYSPPPPPPQPKPPVIPEAPDVCPNIPGKQTSKSQCDVCPNIPGEQSNQNQCYPCPEAKTNTAATACLKFTKKASNQTRGIANAHNTKAQAGDIINYTLSATNTGSVEFKDFVFDENLTDVLEYAEMHEFGGGSLNTKQHLVWPKQSIAAGKTLSVQFAVRIKSPIPSTPQSSSDPGSYDLCMVNVFYGETVMICVQPPVNKQIETVTSTLPNTGPGTSLMITIGIICLVGYFYARNKLLVDELTIVRDDFSAGGTA